MSESGNDSKHYRVRVSQGLAAKLVRLQRQASEQGRGEQMLAAFRELLSRLADDPMNLGERLYQLPALRLNVRCAARRPLVLDFAVSEEALVVFLKAATLLSS